MLGVFFDNPADPFDPKPLSRQQIKDHINYLYSFLSTDVQFPTELDICECEICKEADINIQRMIDSNIFVVQSSDAVEAPVQNDITIMTVGEEEGAHKVENVVDIPANLVDKSSNTDLIKYLNRPVMIASELWDEAALLSTNYYPWYLFFNRTSIKNKVNNYPFIKCNLKIRVLISASPFYYGATMVHYRPLEGFAPAPVSSNTLRQLIPFSQRPSFNIYPQTSTGGEMTLPFLYHKEWLDVTSATDLQNMGRLFLDSFATLKNANSVAGEGATVRIFAWAEDVELSGATIKLAVQGKDEYEHDGPISRPASAVAHYANKLKDWPIIGPFATATGIAGNAISSIASIFGFTNVPNISDQCAFRPTVIPLLASTDIGTAVEKLTLDSKNELTVDNSSYSVGEKDPLAIKSLVTRESYLTKFTWAATDAADARLFSSAVTPSLHGRVDVSSQVYLYGTPMWMVSNLFRFWRGDITFRFVFLCSKFHRGKVRIAWDPVGDITSTADSYTEVFSQIVDLAVDTDIEITIPYHQATAYLENGNYTSAESTQFGTGTITAGSAFNNGIITVRVLNVQTSPVASADIDCLVYVKGSDNMDFGNPRQLSNYYYPYAVQSKDFFESWKVQSGDLDLSRTNLQEMGMEPGEDPSHINLVYQGEKIVSLRTLMRRATFIMSLAPTNFYTTFRNIAYVIRRLPLYPGYDPNGISTANMIIGMTTAPYNYTTFSPINWISQCFVACRGSIIWHCNPSLTVNAGTVQFNRSETTLAVGNYVSAGSTALATEGDASYWGISTLASTQAGATATNPKTQAGVTFLAPMYSKFKFIPTAASERTLGTASLNTDTDSLRGNLPLLLDSTNTGTTQMMNFYCGIGTDYDPVFFLNVPTLYFNSTLPTPTA